jgi:hypothetical protein
LEKSDPKSNESFKTNSFVPFLDRSNNHILGAHYKGTFQASVTLLDAFGLRFGMKSETPAPGAPPGLFGSFQAIESNGETPTPFVSPSQSFHPSPAPMNRNEKNESF